MKGKGKGKGKSKQSNNVDNIMNNINLEGYVDEDMDDGMANFEKQFNPEQQFNVPIYDNIDKEFEKFGKIFGTDEKPNLSSSNKNNRDLSEEDKLLKAILGPNNGVKKKKDSDMEELTKALKEAETNLNKKHGKDNDVDILKDIFEGSENNNNKKKNDGMDELNNILNIADRNLKNKNKDDMDLVRKFLTKEELGEAQGKNSEEKKNLNIIKPEKNEKGSVQKDQNTEEDLYPLQQEKIFHRINQMKSLTVLEKEINLCNFIIQYKKTKNFDSKEWENKIIEANTKLNEIKNKVERGEMDFEEYKKTISNELTYEQKLLNIYLQKDKTSSPSQIEQIKKRINDRIIIINKEIGGEIEDEEEEEKTQGEKKEEKLNSENSNQNIPNPNQSNEEKTKLYVDLLLQQYLSAKDYFKENEFKEQEKDCIDKCKKIIIAKKKILEGKIKEVNLNELPKSIKPEYIYGCSADERTSKFKEILSELIKQKDEIVQKKNAYTETLKKLKKNQFLKVKDTAKNILDSYQTKINKYKEIIEGINEKFKDKWVPAPEYCRNEEEEKVEKINNDIPENTIRIHIGKTNYEKDNVYLKVKLKNGDKELTKEVQLKGNKDFNETWDWQFEKNEYKNLYKKILEIEMERTYWYKFGGSNIKGSVKIDLNSLKDTIQLVGDYNIELVSKRTTPSINVTINLRTPFSGKQFEKVTKEVLNVKKIFPPFNPKAATIPGSIPPKTSNNTTTINTPKEQNHSQAKKEQNSKILDNNINEEKKENDKIIEKRENKDIIEKSEQKPIITETSQKVDKRMFKDEELADVDGVDYLNSLKVLEYKLKILEDQIAKISGRTPRELMQKKIKMSCKIKIIQQQMGDGDVSPQDYHNLLNQQLIHDQALFAFLKQEKDLEKAKLVAIRIKLMNEEITELSQYLK